MANIIPEQTRVVDPFASTNSNVVNRLTELVTHNDNGFLTSSCIEVIPDSTAVDTSVIVTPGYVVKDDVLIKITENHTVDLLDNDNWVTPPSISFSGGNCYLVLQYTYQKQRPAPVATIKILQPSQRDFINTDSSYLLLKVIKLSTTSPYYIVRMYDYDPETGYESNTRKYIKYYAGTEVNLPEHDGDEDRGRIVYELKHNKFYFGYNSEWDELTPGGVSININTDSTGLVIGQLCYVDENGDAALAIGNDLTKCADFAIQSIGTAEEGTGKGIICGFVENAIVEPDTIVYTGNLLYLSATTPGAVTNIRPTGIFQIVGRALSQGSSVYPIDMIFSPKASRVSGISGQISDWEFDSTTNIYYHDIDVSFLDSTGVFDCAWFDENTKCEISPAEVEIKDNGNILRVSFDSSSLIINYMIESPATSAVDGGSVGGGGNTHHEVLLNLDYASSGHTGFAPSPHGNADHSETYITASSVNFTNLDSNGSVGTAGTQVAFGNHTHPEYIDINSGDNIIFVEDTARTGYTLVTSVDDAVVYFTKGSAAGGETGGSFKTGGTWTKPNHTHSINVESDHSHTTPSHTLTIAEMPNHRHPFTSYSNLTSYGSGSGAWNGTATRYTDYEGGGQPHEHGDTGNNGSHDHGGTTGTSATPSSWRPRGLNTTIQTRI